MPATQVLVVDDNRSYRKAFRRNLVLEGFEVQEAGDSREALEQLQRISPQVVVTDLAMHEPTEGLELIRQVRALDPHLPIIMISAVGTFDEGAEATRLGAFRVFSKSRIDEEMESLYGAIRSASEQYARAAKLRKEIDALSSSDGAEAVETLNRMLTDEAAPDSIKGEIFEILARLRREEAPAQPVQELQAEVMEAVSGELLEGVQRTLESEVPGFASLDNETRQSLTTAEYLYRQSRTSSPAVDFSRSMGFAYCFAVENEAKIRLRKKMQRFFGDPETADLIHSLLEDNKRGISIFFQQHLLRTQKGFENEATMDNFFHTFMRILEHRGKYKPDGLKALGIILICFGRTYAFRKFNQEIKVENPLGLKGLDSDDEVMEFAGLLINLQHYRNPYIHPEISEMTKLSKIRETTFACLQKITRLQ